MEGNKVKVGGYIVIYTLTSTNIGRTNHM